MEICERVTVVIVQDLKTWGLVFRVSREGIEVSKGRMEELQGTLWLDVT